MPVTTAILSISLVRAMVVKEMDINTRVMIMTSNKGR